MCTCYFLGRASASHFAAFRVVKATEMEVIASLSRRVVRARVCDSEKEVNIGLSRWVVKQSQCL